MPLKPPSSRKHKSTGQAFCNSLSPVLSKLLIKVPQELGRQYSEEVSGPANSHFYSLGRNKDTLYWILPFPSLKTMSQLNHERAQRKPQDHKRLALMLSIICEHALVLTLNFSLSNGVSKWSWMHISIFISKVKPDYFLKKQIGFGWV